MSIYEDEIDLRPFIENLIRYWWLIALLTVLPVILLLSYSRTQPQLYESTASLLITRTRSQLSLAEQFPTTENDNITNQLSSIQALVDSNGLAAQVFQSIQDQLPPEINTPAAMKSLANIQAQGDLILIQVTTSSPETSALIASEWVKQAEEYINTAYSQGQSLSVIQEQLNAAKNDYEKSQQALEDFLKTNPRQLLENQLNEAKTVFKSQGESRGELVVYYTSRLQQLEDLSLKVNALEAQLENGSGTVAGQTGDQIAVIQARSALLQMGGENPLTVDFTLPSTLQTPADNNTPVSETTLQGWAQDLKTVASLVAQEKTATEEKIAELSQAVSSGIESEELQALGMMIQNLEAENEQLIARERELTAQRELDWQAYSIIAQKETEIRNKTSQSSQIVRSLGDGEAATNPIDRHTIRNVGLAGIIGFLLGLFLVILSTWLKTSNLLTRRETAIKPIR